VKTSPPPSTTPPFSLSRCILWFPNNKWKYPTCLPLLCIPQATQVSPECVRISAGVKKLQKQQNKTSARSDSLLPAWVLWWNQLLLECLRASRLKVPLIVSSSNSLWHTWHCVSMIMLCRFSGEAGHQWLVLIVFRDITIRVCCLSWRPPHLSVTLADNTRGNL